MIDFDLKNNKPVQNNDIYLVLQQIDILFDTVPGELFGDLGFGTEYDHYMYNFNIDNSGLENMILDDLRRLDLLGFSPRVEVMFLQGTEQDIALINITLTRNEVEYKKSYKIS
jgi:hypothetical protein